MVVINPYRSRREIDLRDELERLLFGDLQEYGKARFYVLRRMRRDAQGQLYPCTCQSALTREGDRDHFCAYCHGEGWLWDEEWMPAITARPSGVVRARVDVILPLEAGLLHPDTTLMFVPYVIRPTVDDRILTPLIDTEGRIVLPLRIMEYYRIHKVDAYRSEHGRVDYWRLTARAYLSGLSQEMAAHD